MMHAARRMISPVDQLMQVRNAEGNKNLAPIDIKDVAEEVNNDRQRVNEPRLDKKHLPLNAQTMQGKLRGKGKLGEKNGRKRPSSASSCSSSESGEGTLREAHKKVYFSMNVQSKLAETSDRDKFEKTKRELVQKRDRLNIKLKTISVKDKSYMDLKCLVWMIEGFLTHNLSF